MESKLSTCGIWLIHDDPLGTVNLLSWAIIFLFKGIWVNYNDVFCHPKWYFRGEPSKMTQHVWICFFGVGVNLLLVSGFGMGPVDFGSKQFSNYFPWRSFRSSSRLITCWANFFYLRWSLKTKQVLKISQQQTKNLVETYQQQKWVKIRNVWNHHLVNLQFSEISGPLEVQSTVKNNCPLDPRIC